MNSLTSIFVVRATNRLFRSIVKLLTATAFPIICVRRCTAVFLTDIESFFVISSFNLPCKYSKDFLSNRCILEIPLFNSLHEH